MMLDINLILIFIILAALIAINVKDLISSVVAVGAAGLGLCLAFLTLKAPDLAITQLVIEILCLMILIRATIRSDLPLSISGRWFLNTLIATVFLGFFLYFGYYALLGLPEFGSPLMKTSQYYLKEGLEKVHAANLVSAITLNFRAYDTLGEATILFSAAIGVMLIMRRTGHKKIEEIDEEDKL